MELSSVGCSHCAISVLPALTLLESFSYSVQVTRGRLEKEQVDDIRDLTGKDEKKDCKSCFCKQWPRAALSVD